MDTAAVVIVGGGPAGSACAWKLTQSGVEVVLIDKAEFPRPKVCAGWITPPIVDDLKLDLDDYGRQLVLQPITRFLTGMIGGREVETDYASTVSYGIRRCEFDNYLLRRSGARLRLGESLHSLQRDGAEWIVNGCLRTPLVIGAGGHFCPVARQFRAESAEERPVVLAQEVEFEMSPAEQDACAVLPDRPELLFCHDLKGYGWVFRKNNYLNVGLGREGEDNLSSHTSAFVQYLRDRRKIWFDLPQRFHGHAYRLRTRLGESAPEPGILLIGDALGLADRQSGEGIRPSIESGLLCAASILESGTDRQRIGSRYRERLRETFGDDRGGVSGWLTRSVREFAARQLMKSRWFTRHVLLDQWFLHRDRMQVPA